MRIHLFLQGKGGTGKSTTACFLAQYLTDSGRKVACIDTDPVNNTLMTFRSLNPVQVGIMENGQVNRHRFNQIIDMILSSDADDCVIDNGASSFIPFCNYLITNNWVDFLSASSDIERSVHIHSVVVGGQAYTNTIAGLESLCRDFPEPAHIHVWLNPYFGSVKSRQGKPFEETEAYGRVKERISSIIRLPELDPQVQGYEVSVLLRNGRTFEDADKDGDLSVYLRYQLRLARRRIYEAIMAFGG